MDSLFDPSPDPEQTAFLRRLRALVAPVAADAGAVIDDPEMLDAAQAVYAAYGEGGAAGGLTRAQLTAACPTVRDNPGFDGRVDVFVRMGMLQPVFDKAHQQRFVFNPTAAAGLLVFERLGERGGVDELMTLLDRAGADIRSGTATPKQVQASLRRARHMLTVSADHLLRLVSSAPMAELVAERRHHAQVDLLERVHGLTGLVAESFPDLDPQAYRVVVEAQRYVGARESFVGRLIDEGAASRDFSLLDPEDYLTAARTAPTGALAAVFAGTVFDPPSPWVDPSTVADAVREARPRPAARERPPRPSEEPPGVDPLEAALERARRARQARVRAVELRLGSDRESELVDAMRGAGWPGAAAVLVMALAAAADPTVPVTATMTDELLVDPDGPVTYLTPVTLRRTGPPPGLPVAGAASTVPLSGSENGRREAVDG